MSATASLVAKLRRKLGHDAPLASPQPSLPITAAPQHVFPRPKHKSAFQTDAAAHTTALVGIGHVGTRYGTDVVLQFQAELALAHFCVASPLPHGWCEQAGLLPIQTMVVDHKQYLARPDLGRRLRESSRTLLQQNAMFDVDVQPILADGLSAQACVQSGLAVLDSLRADCERRGLSIGTPMCARHARVWLQDEIGELLRAKVCVIILGERPGLGTGDGLSAYMVYQPKVGKTDSDRNMISNIHSRGISPHHAAERLGALASAMIAQGVSGVALDLTGLHGEGAMDELREPQVREPLVNVEP